MSRSIESLKDSTGLCKAYDERDGSCYYELLGLKYPPRRAIRVETARGTAYMCGVAYAWMASLEAKVARQGVCHLELFCVPTEEKAQEIRRSYEVVPVK